MKMKVKRGRINLTKGALISNKDMMVQRMDMKEVKEGILLTI